MSGEYIISRTMTQLEKIVCESHGDDDWTQEPGWNYVTRLINGYEWGISQSTNRLVNKNLMPTSYRTHKVGESQVKVGEVQWYATVRKIRKDKNGKRTDSFYAEGLRCDSPREAYDSLLNCLRGVSAAAI